MKCFHSCNAKRRYPVDYKHVLFQPESLLLQPNCKKKSFQRNKLIGEMFFHFLSYECVQRLIYTPEPHYLSNIQELSLLIAHNEMI